MFVAERIKKIKNILSDYKHVDVSSLSTVLSVSEATIRRDLERLEKEGFLKRTHGGAVLNEEVAPETSILASDIVNLEEKSLIGHIASQLVENQEVIIIGAGTTCLQFSKSLKDKKDLTIVTNNILISTELSKCRDIKAILTGGDVFSTEDSLSLVGEFCNKMLDDVYVSKAFLSVNGADLNYGYSASNVELALVWKKMCSIAEEVIILCDYSKFGKRSFVSLGPLNLAHKIVTNDQVPDEFKCYYYEKGIPIYTSYKVEI